MKVKVKPMTKYIALLRGINVGGNNLIRMGELRAEFEGAGFLAVRTYIQSGNVLFESELKDEIELEKKIEKMLSERFKYKARVLIRSEKDLEKIVAHFPEIFGNEDWKHNVIFLSAAIDSKEILNKIEIKEGIEEASYFSGALFWSARKDALTRSNMLKLAGKPEYKEMTIRNINTTKKLLELLTVVKI